MSEGRADATGSLCLGSVLAPTEAHAARVLSWWQKLETLGVSLPLVLVHDLGLSLALPDEALTIGPRAPAAGADAATAGELARLAREIRMTLSRGAIAAMRASDDLISAVLATLLSRYGAGARFFAAPASDLVAPPSTLTAWWARADRATLRREVERVTSDRLALLTRLDALDVDTLRLSSAMGDDALATLVTALDEPQGELISRMTLEVLPTVLEDRKKRGVAAGNHGGIEGLGTRGDLDSLSSTELAWDDDELIRRLLFDEALHLSRQASTAPEPRHHVIVVDATAAMRGDRAIFARALALSLAKKLHLAGDAVTIRFFDARLYEPIHVGERLPVSEVVGFRAEGGRNVARVIDALAAEVEAMARRTQRRIVVHLVTHGATVAPRTGILRLLRAAEVTATLVSPRAGTDAGFLDLLTSHSTVTARDAADPARRRARAVELLTGDRG